MYAATLHSSGFAEGGGQIVSYCGVAGGDIALNRLFYRSEFYHHAHYSPTRIDFKYNNTTANGNFRIGYATDSTYPVDYFGCELPMQILDTTESSSISTGCCVFAGGLGVAKRVSALNMTCTTAPVAATDVVRKTELDAISGTTGMARFAAIGIGQAPIANVPISINADGMFDPQIQITDAASDVYNFRLRTAGDTGSELSLGCTYGPYTTSGLFAIANGIVLTTNDTTDVSWSVGGPPLGTVVEPYPTRIKGGLFVEKQIACTSRLTAANVTCASMPSADTDVMRKVDIVNCSATLSGTWTVIWESTNPVQTIKVVRYGSLVCMSATLWVMGFTNASGSSPYSLTLASDYRPVNTQTFQIAGYTLVTEPSDTILERSLALNVTDAGAISLHPCYNQTFISGEFIYISAFSVVWTIV